MFKVIMGGRPELRKDSWKHRILPARRETVLGTLGTLGTFLRPLPYTTLFSFFDHHFSIHGLHHPRVMDVPNVPNVPTPGQQVAPEVRACS